MATSLGKRVSWFWRECLKPLRVVGLLLDSFRSALVRPNHRPPGEVSRHRGPSWQRPDSRFRGFVDRRPIVGGATAVVLSLDHERGFRTRWSRFPHALS